MHKAVLRGQCARANLVFSAFLLGAAILAAHLFLLQAGTGYGNQYVEMTSSRWDSFDTPHAKRGNILFSDGALAAGSRKVGRVIADPQLFSKYSEVAEILSRHLDINQADIEHQFRSYGGRGLVLAEGVPLDVALSLDRERLRGIFVRYYYERYYPFAELGAPATLGYAGRFDFQRIGLEYSLDSELTGQDGRIIFRHDADNNPLPGSVQEIAARSNGKDVVTTLHSSFQLVCEDELRKAVATNGAKMACAIVMEPDSGDVLAAATYPAFDPNQYVSGELGQEFNVMVHRVIEPGSTIKPLIAAYALDHKWVDKDKRYVCNRTLKVNGYQIREAETSHLVGGNNGVQLGEIIVQSSNIGMAQVAMGLGPDKLMDCLFSWGFFNKTGIELPVECAGLKPYHYEQSKHENKLNWPRITTANVGFGQGLAVTPIQLASAYCVIANGGYRVRPTLLLKHDQPETEMPKEADNYLEKLFPGQVLVSSNEDESEDSPDGLDPARIRVISKPAADEVSEWLAEVVARGTGKKAQLKRYTAAGKTGTAQIPDPKGGYKKGAYLASFVGYFPVEDPRYVVLVMFWEPRGEYYGGQVAAPVFKAIGDRITHIDELIQIGVAGDAA